MKKLFKKYSMITGVLLCLVFVVMVAAIPTNIVRTFHLWVGETTATSGQTVDDNDAYIQGTLEVDGVLYADGGISDTTGGVTATEIADITRSIPLQLFSAVIDTAGTITVMNNNATTDPGIAAADGVPAIVYGSSAEKASIGWSFPIPEDYSSGLAFRMIISSDSDVSYASLGVRWGLYVNNPSTAFDAASYGQTIVWNTNPSPATSNVLLTFTANTTAAADIASGDTVTVWFGGGDYRTGAAKTLEIKSVEARYTAIQ